MLESTHRRIHTRETRTTVHTPQGQNTMLWGTSRNIPNKVHPPHDEKAGRHGKSWFSTFEFIHLPRAWAEVTTMFRVYIEWKLHDDTIFYIGMHEEESVFVALLFSCQ